jgi:predicted lactoylglutathione lyase
MKSWFINLFVKQIFTSKKFIYAISSVIIPVITNALSVDEQTSTNLFIALLSLAGFQGLADFGSAKKK